MILRPALPEDFDFLFSLRRQTMKSYVEQTWGRWDDDEQSERFRGEFAPSKDQIIITGGNEIGCLTVEDHDDFLFIDFIAVLPEYQRMGIGAKLIAGILAQADERNIPVRLNCLKVNPARSLYERLGFRVVGGDEFRHHMERAAREPSPAQS